MIDSNTELEGGVRIKDLNMNQDPRGIAEEYQKKVKQNESSEAFCDTPKEEMEPSREGERMVRRGRLNAATGAEIPLLPKTRTVLVKQSCPSPEYLGNFDQIAWDKTDRVGNLN